MSEFFSVFDSQPKDKKEKESAFKKDLNRKNRQLTSRPPLSVVNKNDLNLFDDTNRNGIFGSSSAKETLFKSKSRNDKNDKKFFCDEFMLFTKEEEELLPVEKMHKAPPPMEYDGVKFEMDPLNPSDIDIELEPIPDF